MSKTNFDKAIETAKTYNPSIEVFSYKDIIDGNGGDAWGLFESCGANSGIPFAFNTKKKIKLPAKDSLKLGGDNFLMRNGKKGYTLGIWMEYDDGEVILVPLSIFRRLPSSDEERTALQEKNAGAPLLQKMFDIQRIAVLYSIFGSNPIEVTECTMHQSYYKRLADGSSQFVRDSSKLPEEERRPYTCYKFNVAK